MKKAIAPAFLPLFLTASTALLLSACSEQKPEATEHLARAEAAADRAEKAANVATEAAKSARAQNSQMVVESEPEINDLADDSSNNTVATPDVPQQNMTPPV